MQWWAPQVVSIVARKTRHGATFVSMLNQQGSSLNRHMNTSIDTTTSVLILLVVVALALLLASVLLYRSKRLKEKQKRGNIIPIDHTDRGEAIAIPVRVVKRGDTTQGPPRERILVHRNANAENEIFNLDAETHRLVTQGQIEEAKAAAERALSVALKKLTGDHWLIARLLNRLAYVELSLSDNYRALTHLEAAQAIISEWPGKSPNDESVIAKNLAYCHDVLGF